jgi:hypothetical protein
MVKVRLKLLKMMGLVDGIWKNEMRPRLNVEKGWQGFEVIGEVMSLKLIDYTLEIKHPQFISSLNQLLLSSLNQKTIKDRCTQSNQPSDVHVKLPRLHPCPIFNR